MADDCMLLNFDLQAGAFALPRTRMKGGSWKDRLTARKSAEYGRRKAQEHSNASKQSGSGQTEQQYPPHKRVKTSNNVIQPTAIANEVISSLFTHNPTSTVPVKNAETVDDAPVKPSNAPIQDVNASMFTSLGISGILADHLLRKLDIRAPTAIQRQAVKQLCAYDTDAFIQSQTGSGKTLAYLLPIIERIASISRQMKDSGESFDRHSGLFAIILAPTRELSKQISTVLNSLLSCYPWIVSGTVTGGEKKKSEKARLRKGLNVLVATPGRCADHIDNTEVLDLSNVRWLVLDEGDRLMDLGFEQDIQKIVSVLNLRSRKKHEKATPGLPDKRTTVLCSATIKANVEQLQSISLKNPVSIAVKTDSRDTDDSAAHQNNFSAPSQLKQNYAIVPPKQRLVTLIAVLRQAFKRKGSVMKSIVFMSCADSVDFHFELLTAESISTETQQNSMVTDVQWTAEKMSHRVPRKPGRILQGNTISDSITKRRATNFSTNDNQVNLFRLHGSLQQATRTSTLKDFADTMEPAVLVCTDVAARGLDLPNVDLVIEYDPPFSKDDHLHRIGRTARAGREGRAMIFLQPGCEEGYIEILMESKPRNLTRHDADVLLKKGFAKEDDSNEFEWEQHATDWQIDIERWALQNSKHLEQARRAYQSHIRAYATHILSERKIFNMQELHLGHLAKAFALRDKPSTIKVPGLRPEREAANKKAGFQQKNTSRQSMKRQSGYSDASNELDSAHIKRKMMSKLKNFASVDEFNIG